MLYASSSSWRSAGTPANAHQLGADERERELETTQRKAAGLVNQHESEPERGIGIRSRFEPRPAQQPRIVRLAEPLMTSGRGNV